MEIRGQMGALTGLIRDFGSAWMDDKLRHGE